jgi:hypothetical protein
VSSLPPRMPQSASLGAGTSDLVQLLSGPSHTPHTTSGAPEASSGMQATGLPAQSAQLLVSPLSEWKGLVQDPTVHHHKSHLSSSSLLRPSVAAAPAGSGSDFVAHQPRHSATPTPNQSERRLAATDFEMPVNLGLQGPSPRLASFGAAAAAATASSSSPSSPASVHVAGGAGSIINLIEQPQAVATLSPQYDDEFDATDTETAVASEAHPQVESRSPTEQQSSVRSGAMGGRHRDGPPARLHDSVSSASLRTHSERSVEEGEAPDLSAVHGFGSSSDTS